MHWIPMLAWMLSCSVFNYKNFAPLFWMNGFWVYKKAFRGSDFLHAIEAFVCGRVGGIVLKRCLPH